MADAVGIAGAATPGRAAVRLAWLDQLRAVAMYFVIVGHAVAAGSQLETFIYSFHMPLFFIISGMTFHPDRYATVTQCAIDKAKKLLVPYVLLSIATIPWWILNWRILGNVHESVRDLLVAILISNQSIANSPANAMWFLPALFLLSILFTAIWKLGAGKIGRISVMVAGCGVMGILLSLRLDKPVPWHLPTVLTAAVFYYAGYLFMRYRDSITAVVANRRDILVALVVVFFAAGTFFAMVNGKVSMHDNQYKSVPLFFLSAFLLSAAVILGVYRLPTFKWVAYLGQNTLVVLAIHVPMLRTIQNFSPAGLAFTYDHSALAALLVFIACIPLAMFVNRFAPFLVAKKYPKKPPPGGGDGSG